MKASMKASMKKICRLNEVCGDLDGVMGKILVDIACPDDDPSVYFGTGPQD
jgi:hypothetical protein